MARKSNVEKALEEILAELKPIGFKSKDAANEAIGNAIKSKSNEYNLDDEKQKELLELIKENKDSLNIEGEKPLSELELLKRAFAKLACMTGNRAICLEYNLEPWEPGKKDMSKYNR